MINVKKKISRFLKIIFFTIISLVILLLLFIEGMDRFFTTDYGISYFYNDIGREINIKKHLKGNI